jgi:hypothetical protein
LSVNDGTEGIADLENCSIFPKIRSTALVDIDPFLTTLYVMVDDFCTTALPAEFPLGPQAALNRSEVLTLAIFGPWQGFGSERGFSRSAPRHLRVAFPQLPTREQCKRQRRQQHDALVACFLPLVRLLAAQRGPYEALDSSGVPTRDAKRRGAGWLPGLADMGCWCTSSARR